ncbi:MAG: YebC/PmpR family DNA-binding transcriptional regulator [Patescibacteria group bacterium]
MSGHSKWATTKRAKAVVDAKRATVFTRLANAITLAAREKGGDPTTNFSLRLAIEKARGSNMPKENIERAIKRGTGEGGGVQPEEIIYEGYGPGGVAILVHTLTDNRNRTVSEIKHIFSSNGGNLGSANSVGWMFEKQGVLGISQLPTEEQELALIECGVNDIQKNGDEVTLITSPQDLQKARACVEQFGIPLVFAEFDYRATTTASLCQTDKERLEVLCNELDGLDDVTDYYSNV